MAFPEGLPPTTVPVHPNQLYEAAALIPIAWLLFRWRKQQRDDRFLLGMYFVMAGALRFLIEFVRVNERVAGPLTVAHVASLLAIILGLSLLTTRTKGPA